jgi:hypothetical protein
LNPGETVKLYVKPGERVLRAGKDGLGLCNISSGNYSQRETVVGKGQTKSFRLASDSNGTPDIQRAD